MLHESLKLKREDDDVVHSVDKLEAQPTDMTKGETEPAEEDKKIIISGKVSSTIHEPLKQRETNEILPVDNLDFENKSEIGDVAGKKVTKNENPVTQGIAKAIGSIGDSDEVKQEMQEFITHEIFQFKENKSNDLPIKTDGSGNKTVSTEKSISLNASKNTSLKNSRNNVQISPPLKQKTPTKVLQNNQKTGQNSQETAVNTVSLNSQKPLKVSKLPQKPDSDVKLARRSSTSSLEISLNELSNRIQLQNKIRPEIKSTTFHGSGNQITVRDCQVPLTQPVAQSPRQQTGSVPKNRTNFRPRTPSIKENGSIFDFEEDIITKEQIRDIVRSENQAMIESKDQEIAVLKAQLECYKNQVEHLENLTLKLFMNK